MTSATFNQIQFFCAVLEKIQNKVSYEQLRVFTQALDGLPDNMKKVRLRSDTAGYQYDLLDYCGGKFPYASFGANAAWWWIWVPQIFLTNLPQSLY